MKTEIQVFDHELFGKIRMIQDENNEPWFVGKDVASILGYANPRKAIIDHIDEDDKMDGVTIRDSIGREQKPILINESGLYSLILSSKLPDAKKFKRWVTSVVLPQIRKTGGYIPVDAEDDDMTILCKAVKILNRTVEEKESIIMALIPKAEFADQISSSEGCIYIGEMAKILRQNGVDTSPKRFFKWLRDNGYLFKHSRDPIHKWVESGIFNIKLSCFEIDGVMQEEITTVVTPKGQQYFLKTLTDPLPQPLPHNWEGGAIRIGGANPSHKVNQVIFLRKQPQHKHKIYGTFNSKRLKERD